MTKTISIIVFFTICLSISSCNKDHSSYIIGEWSIEAIRYDNINYIDSLLLRYFVVNQGDSKIFFPFKPSSSRNIDYYDEDGTYSTFISNSKSFIIFNSKVPEIRGQHNYEFRNDTLRRCLLMIIQSKYLYIRAIRLNFTYDSPSGLKIVDKFEKWPKNGEYEFVPLPDSVLR